MELRNSSSAKESGDGDGHRHVGAALDNWRMPSPAQDKRLNDALTEGRFVLYSQPIVELRSRRVEHHEVLLRLQEGADQLSPGYFLEAAERFGMIREIDRMVVAGAIGMLGNGGAGTLAVNLSGPSLGDAGLLAMIEERLIATGVTPSRLVFEVTESSAIRDMSGAIDFAKALRAMGCRLALDDFGVGFGSLYYLKHLPFDYVKIDGEFVRELTSSRHDRAVVAGVVEMAHGMGLTTIAEFVGDEETVEALLELGVDCGQGYHLGMPAPVSEVRRPAKATPPSH